MLPNDKDNENMNQNDGDAVDNNKSHSMKNASTKEEEMLTLIIKPNAYPNMSTTINELVPSIPLLE